MPDSKDGFAVPLIDEIQQRELPSVILPKSKSTYVWAIVVMFMLGFILILVSAVLRPQQDILVLIEKVGAVLFPTTAAVLAFLKAEETHLSVNSRLDAFMRANALVARSEGHMQGTKEEQARVGGFVAALSLAGQPIPSQEKYVALEVSEALLRDKKPLLPAVVKIVPVPQPSSLYKGPRPAKQAPAQLKPRFGASKK